MVLARRWTCRVTNYLQTLIRPVPVLARPTHCLACRTSPRRWALTRQPGARGILRIVPVPCVLAKLGNVIAKTIGRRRSCAASVFPLGFNSPSFFCTAGPGLLRISSESMLIFGSGSRPPCTCCTKFGQVEAAAERLNNKTASGSWYTVDPLAVRVNRLDWKATIESAMLDP